EGREFAGFVGFVGFDIAHRAHGRRPSPRPVSSSGRSGRVESHRGARRGPREGRTMKIEGPGYGSEASRAEGSPKPDAPAPSARPSARAGSAGAAPADDVAISAAALEIQRLLDAAKTSPDVRTSLVERLRAQIRSGDYQVDDRSLAIRIIDEYLA